MKSRPKLTVKIRTLDPLPEQELKKLEDEIRRAVPTDLAAILEIENVTAPTKNRTEVTTCIYYPMIAVKTNFSFDRDRECLSRLRFLEEKGYAVSTVLDTGTVGYSARQPSFVD